MAWWQFAETAYNIRVAFDGLQALAVDVEDADHLIGACGKHQLRVVHQNTPDWAIVSSELSYHAALRDIPYEDLTVPTSTDDLVAIFTECQACDVASMAYKQSVGIFIRRPPYLLDEDKRLSPTGRDESTRMLFRRRGVGETVEPVRALQSDRVVVGERGGRDEAPLSDGVVS